MQKLASYGLLAIILLDRRAVRPKHVMSFGMEKQKELTQQQPQTSLSLSTEEIQQAVPAVTSGPSPTQELPTDPIAITPAPAHTTDNSITSSTSASSSTSSKDKAK